jgi:choline dehydrogenase-like flavoprotein
MTLITAKQRIVYDAIAHGAHSTHELMQACKMSKSAIYNHAARLIQERFVKNSKDGYVVAAGAAEKVAAMDKKSGEKKPNGHTNGNGTVTANGNGMHLPSRASSLPEIRRLRTLHSQLGDAIDALERIAIPKKEKDALVSLVQRMTE